MVADLKELGLNGRMPNLKDFINNRNFQVQLGDTLSIEKKQEMGRGVPHESYLICHTIQH